MIPINIVRYQTHKSPINGNYCFCLLLLPSAFLISVYNVSQADLTTSLPATHIQLVNRAHWLYLYDTSTPFLPPFAISTATVLLCLLPGWSPHIYNYIFPATIILLEYQVSNVTHLPWPRNGFFQLDNKIFSFIQLLVPFKDWYRLTFLSSHRPPPWVSHIKQAQGTAIVFC